MDVIAAVSIGEVDTLQPTIDGRIPRTSITRSRLRTCSGEGVTSGRYQGWALT